MLVTAVAVFWLAKRRRRATWTEAVCPACIGLRLLAEHAPALAGLTGDDAAAAAVIPAGEPSREPAKDRVNNPGPRRG